MQSAREIANSTGLDVVDAAEIASRRYAECRLALLSFLVGASQQLTCAMVAAEDIEETIPPILRDAASEITLWLRSLGVELDEHE